MKEIKALEDMRNTVKTIAADCDEGWILECLDDIEAEVAERFMELPVDADGVPIRVGDTLECHANGYNGVFDAFAIGDGCVIGNHPECELFNNPFKGIHVAKHCHHAKPRTVEDVLRDLEGLRWHRNFTYRDVVTRAAELADEIRELMGGAE